MDVITIETAQLGNRSYLLHDGRSALVVDPVRDVDRIEIEAERAGVRIVAVAETHIHNDYVSGGLALARRHAVEYLVAAEELVGFERRSVRDGTTVEVGELVVEAVGTPGHTPHHLAFLATKGDAPPALFSGGSLLYGTVGRTDLIGPDLTDALTRQQYRGVRRLAERLSPTTRVYPTHGFGSFCSSGSTDTADVSTIGEQLRSNDALLDDDENAFVERLIRGLGAYPRYYSAMAPLNRAGAGPIEFTELEPLSPAGVRDRVRTNMSADLNANVVVDLRSRERFADGHVPGTISVEYASNFATYVGWVLPWGVELTLIGDSPEQIADARTDLARIGIEQVSAVSTAAVDVPTYGELSRYRRARWEELADERPERIVDVRRHEEYAAVHLSGALSMPIHELPDQRHALPDGQLWVHCQSGYRAGIAASLLRRAGHDVVHVDDDFQRAQEIGLSMAGATSVPSTGS